MAQTYQNSQGQYFNSQADAAASNTSLGTNPFMTGNVTPPTVSTPSTVTAPAIGNNTGAFALPPNTPSTYGGLINGFQSGIQQAQQGLDNQQSALDQQMLGLVQGTNQLGQQGNDYQSAINSPAFRAQQQGLADANLKFTQLKNGYDQTFANIEKQAIPKGFVTGQIAETQRQAAVAIGAQAAIVQTLQGNLETAKQTIKDTIDAKYQGLEATLNAKKMFFEYNKDNFDTKQKNLAEKQNQLIDLKLKKIEADKQWAQQNASNAISLLKDGAITGEQAANVMSGKISLASALTDLSGKASQDFEATLKKASQLEGVTKSPMVYKDLVGYLASKDYKSAYDQVGNSVSNSLTGSNKTKFDDARADVQVMSGLAGAIKAYQDAGGDTGLLKGKAQDISQKLGNVKDPALATLATELNREFQAYRNAMTGAAFTDKESREYASVNPTTGKSLDLNYAVIAGALNQLNNRVDGTIRSKVGEGATYLKEYADGVGQPLTDQQATTKLTQWGQQSPNNLTLIQQATTMFPDYSAADIYQILGINQ